MNIKESVKEELLGYINDLKNDGVLTEDNKDEWYQLAFNEGYYVANREVAIKWLDDHGLDAFHVINEIIEHELGMFGEIYTKVSSPEVVVRRYISMCSNQLLN